MATGMYKNVFKSAKNVSRILCYCVQIHSTPTCTKIGIKEIETIGISKIPKFNLCVYKKNLNTVVDEIMSWQQKYYENVFNNEDG